MWFFVLVVVYEKLAAPVNKLVENTKNLVEDVLVRLVDLAFKDYAKLGKVVKREVRLI